jgi:intracellular multiplication protein IcmB
MGKWVENFFDGFDTFLAWLSTFLKQYTLNYCDLETADSETVLVNHDGTLVSILELDGTTILVGQSEFQDLIAGLNNALQGAMGRPGFAFQIFFSYDKDNIKNFIQSNFKSAQETASRLELELHDLFKGKMLHRFIHKAI